MTEEPLDFREYDSKPNRGRRSERRTDAKTAFNPNGIGSNIFLTAAAAVVPMVIVGVAGVAALTGKRRLKGGRQ